MTAKYQRDDLSFQYPENWQLDEDPPRGFPRSISVTSASGAFWSAMVYDQPRPLAELRSEYLQALEQEYEEVEETPVRIQIESESLAGADVQFFCLDFLVRSRLLGVQLGERTLLVTWQAEDREFEEIEPVFRAISLSLLQQSK